MPDVVASGLGFTILAGIISGICYIFVQGFKNDGITSRKKLQAQESHSCCCCDRQFTNNGPEEQQSPNEESAACTNCNGRACNTIKCGRYVQGKWLCNQCFQNNDKITKRSWYKGLLTVFQPNTVTVKMSKKPETEPKVETLTKNDENEKEIVRDFIERLVGAMLGADLDDTSVSKLFKDKEYDDIFTRNHYDLSNALTELGSALHISIANLPQPGQTPCTAHASLKYIIRRVLRDASNMAILKQPQNEIESTSNPNEPNTTNRTYEDLLATAILNKVQLNLRVIDNYQTDLRRSSSSGSTSSLTKRKRSKTRTKQLDDELLETSSISSVEDWCRSESSCGSKYVDHLSFTIKQSIAEISSSEDDDDDDDHSNKKKEVKMEENEELPENWQDNWLFSRRRKGSPNSVPVPMLVPNPSTEYRALIGDRDADDTTDLSETGSDFEHNIEEEEVEEEHQDLDIKTILIDSKTIIGGKNVLERISAELLEASSLEQEEVETKETKISEARNDNLVFNNICNTESDSLGSNTEKDVEYTEKYASFPRQIVKNNSPISSPRISKNGLTDEEKQELNDNYELIENQNEEGIRENFPEIIKGSYSEKERRKWENPIALEHNPYSKENLSKRIERKKSPFDFTFDSDYCVRESRKATGGDQTHLQNNSWQHQQWDSFNNNNRTNEQDEDDEDSKHDFTIDQSLQLTPEQHRNNIINLLELEAPNWPSTMEHKENDTQSLALSTDSELEDNTKRVFNIETGELSVFQIPTKTEPEPPKRDILKEGLIYPDGMRDISKKYLQSLVKGGNTKSKPEFANTYTTPPISLQEYGTNEEEQSQIQTNGVQEDEIDTQIKHDEETTIKTTSDLEELKNTSLPSVSNLKKLFDYNRQNETNGAIENADNDLTTATKQPEIRAPQQQIHSLTARNLPKEFRRELQISISDKSEEEMEEVKEDDELKTLPGCKSKIEFFELLKNNQ